MRRNPGFARFFAALEPTTPDSEDLFAFDGYAATIPTIPQYMGWLQESSILMAPTHAVGLALCALNPAALGTLDFAIGMVYADLRRGARDWLLQVCRQRPRRLGGSRGLTRILGIFWASARTGTLMRVSAHMATTAKCTPCDA